MKRRSAVSICYFEFPNLRIEFPDIFTNAVMEDVIGNFARNNVVMVGISNSSYEYYRDNKGDKVIWWDLYLWNKDYFNNNQTARKKPIEVGRMRTCPLNVAKHDCIPVVTFFSGNRVSKRDLELVPDKQCYEWTGDSIDSYAKTYKTLTEFCRNEIPEYCREKGVILA